MRTRLELPAAKAAGLYDLAVRATCDAGGNWRVLVTDLATDTSVNELVGGGSRAGRGLAALARIVADAYCDDVMATRAIRARR